MKTSNYRGVDHSLYSSYTKLQGIYSVFLEIPDNMVFLTNSVPFWVGFWEYSEIYSKYSRLEFVGIEIHYGIFPEVEDTRATG